MRGILIDPFKRTVTEVDTIGNLAAIYELLGVDCVTAVSVGENQILFLDDEGLFVPKEEQEYWHLKGSNQPYAGKGLLLGLDEEGENIDSAMTFWEVNLLVTFLDKANVNPEEFSSVQIIAW
jgi:muramoyltetrapeptide carboxypeptidase LdcA involved in peptidoglycan recycling